MEYQTYSFTVSDCDGNEIASGTYNDQETVWDDSSDEQFTSMEQEMIEEHLMLALADGDTGEAELDEYYVYTEVLE